MTHNIKISFGITTHNEGKYIETLLNQLIPFCEESGDEIVIVDDFSTDDRTQDILNKAEQYKFINIYKHSLNKNFAEQKNYLNSKCVGSYIFQIDADETLHPSLLENLHWLVENNQTVDLFAVPRVNTVEGLTDEDIKRWGWRISKVESQTDEKMIDTDSDEYKMLKKYGLIIEETAL